MKKITVRLFKIISSLCVVGGYIYYNSVNVFADITVEKSPWVTLSGEDKTNANLESTSIDIYNLLRRIGIYGCLITILIFAITMLLMWNDPQKKAEAKSKIIIKFAVLFVICACAYILGLILDIVKYVGGY